MTIETDLLIIGAGPAGLSAAINGASEGLKITLVDSGPELGGQAVRSSLIENYPGFPDGKSGQDLMNDFVRQARKFNTRIECPQTAIGLRQEGDRKVVVMDDEQEVVAKMVILSAGLSYRRLAAPGIGGLMGRGVLYGAPTYDPARLGDCNICIVGGANSAGQAAMHMSRNPKAHVKLLIRKKIEAQMSQYLIDRITNCSNIDVIEGVEVVEVKGDSSLECVTVKNDQDERQDIPSNHLFIFIGAMPKTMWLNGSIAMDQKRFILTGSKIPQELWKSERPPLGFETSMPGVFACGDVRLGSTKRIASAVGEGSVALQMCHEFNRLAESS